MELKDVMSPEEWEALERVWHRISGLNVAVMDREGARVTPNPNWANRLCPAVKTHPSAGQAICALAHQNLASQAMENGGLQVGVCDLGLFKFCAPVKVNGETLGVLTGCGRLPAGEELDLFYASKTTGLDDEQVAELAESVEDIDEVSTQETLAILVARLKQALKEAEGPGGD